MDASTPVEPCHQLRWSLFDGARVWPPELRAEMADPAKRYQVDPSRYYFRTNPL
jgi:hypothetical protein